MFGFRAKRKYYANGLVWPDTGSDTIGGVKAVFGGRLFPAHVATVGYDYDFHRGVDVPLEVGDEYYSPINGHVTRSHVTHFEFPTTYYQAYWTEDNDGAGATWAHANPGLTITGTRGGSNSYPNVAKYLCNRPIEPVANEWELRLQLSSTTAINGALGFGLYDTKTSEYLAMEWDGTNVRALGARSGGNITNHDTTTSVAASRDWLRIRSNGGNLTFGVSDDGETWVTAFTESNPTLTNTHATWRAVMYYRSKDTNATPDTIQVAYIGWYDDTTIPRFGNWATVAGEDHKILTLHLADVYVASGDIVRAGQSLGTVGLTGFDDRSGKIQTPHVHLEYCTNTLSAYSQSDAVNPLRSTILPRDNVSNNVSVTSSDANDPDGVASVKLAVVATRQDQDFDLNVFEVVGTTATRTVNWDTRAGLNSDADIPKQSGVYFVAQSFNGESSQYQIDAYFNKSVIGAPTAAYVKDCNGTTLWSKTDYPLPFPTTSAGLAASLGGSGSWTEIWNFEEASGNPTGTIGSRAMTKSTTAFSYHQSGPMTGKYSIKVTHSGHGLGYDFASGAVGTSDWACLMTVYIPSFTANRQLLSMPGYGGGTGWKNPTLWYTAGTTGLDMRHYNAAAGSYETLSQTGLTTGTWHDIMLVYVRNTGLRLHSSFGSVQTDTSPFVGEWPDWSGSFKLWLGANPEWGVSTITDIQYAYFAFTLDETAVGDLYTNGATRLSTFRGLR